MNQNHFLDPFRIEQMETPLSDDYETITDESDLIYENLSLNLAPKFPDGTVTPQWLKSLKKGLLYFNNTYLSASNFSSIGLTKLPWHLIHDFRPNGTFSLIVDIVKSDEANRIINWSSTDQLALNIALYKEIQSSIIQSGFWTPPMIYFDNSIPIERQNELSNIVRLHGGSICSDLTSSSHYIVSESSKCPQTSDSIRILSHKPGKMYIHWIYKPDSFDQWVPEEDVRGEKSIFIRPTHKQQFSVRESWIIDLSIYNEWMNELDYDPDPINNSSLNKTFLNYSQTTDLMKKRLPPEPLSARVGIKKNPVLMIPQVKQREENDLNSSSSPSNPNSKLMNKEKNSSINSNRNSMKANITDKRSSLNSLDSDRKKSYSQSISNARVTIPYNEFQEVSNIPKLVPPSHTSWFDLNKIHSIEEAAFPDFFQDGIQPRSSNKTREIYREYRDFMIYTYQQNPSQYLTVTACRRNLCGDVCSIMRIHDFLEHVGLINYAVQANIQGFFPLTNDLPESEETMEKLLDLEKQIFKEGEPIGTYSEDNNFIRQNEKSKDYIENNNNNNNSDRINSNNSNVNNNNNNININISNISCGDNNNNNLDVNEKEWTEEETLLLLEAIERCGEDWDSIASIVGTKDKADCLLHFVKLKIESPHYQDYSIEHKNSKIENNLKNNVTNSTDSSTFGKPKNFKNEFSNENGNNKSIDECFKNMVLENKNSKSQDYNAIMNILYFLRKTVDHSIASASAQAAFNAYMTKNHPEVKNLNLKEKFKSFKNADLDINEDHNKMSIDAENERDESPNSDKMNPSEKRKENPDIKYNKSKATNDNNDDSNEKNIDKKSNNNNVDENFLIQIQAASSAALAAATLKSVLLDEKEEREVQKLIYQIIDAKMQQLELKMQYFDELEEYYGEQKRKIKEAQTKLFAERLEFLEEKRLWKQKLKDSNYN